MDMDGLVTQALDEAKGAGANQKAESKDAAVSKDAEMKAVEAALAHRIVGRIAGIGGYGYGYIPTYPLAYPLHPEVGKAVAAVNAIHNSIIAYEYANAIAGLVAPSVDAVTKVLESITDTSGMKSGAKSDSAASSSTAPASTSNLQLNAEGVPVLVNPVLMTNEVSDVDLGMRNWVLDGVNGYDLVQLNGVPVLVNPESELLTNEVAGVRLNPCEDVNGNSRVCLVGPDDVAIVQTEAKGVPVLVNPESELLTNEAAAVRLNPCVDVNGKPKVCEVGPDEIVMAQQPEAVTLQVNGVPVLVNPESDLMSNDMGSARLNPCEDINGKPKKCEVGPDELTLSQRKREVPQDAVTL